MPDQDGNLFASDELQTTLGAPYTDFHCQITYSKDFGVLPVPIAAVGAAPALIAVHGGRAQKIVKWTVEREGAKPLAPNPYALGEFLLDTHIGVVTPMLAPDGQVRAYRLSGTYIYHDTTEPGDELKTVQSPYDQQADGTYHGSDFQLGQS